VSGSCRVGSVAVESDRYESVGSALASQVKSSQVRRSEVRATPTLSRLGTARPEAGRGPRGSRGRAESPIAPPHSPSRLWPPACPPVNCIPYVRTSNVERSLAHATRGEQSQGELSDPRTRATIGESIQQAGPGSHMAGVTIGEVDPATSWGPGSHKSVLPSGRSIQQAGAPVHTSQCYHRGVDPAPVHTSQCYHRGVRSSRLAPVRTSQCRSIVSYMYPAV